MIDMQYQCKTAECAIAYKVPSRFYHFLVCVFDWF